MLNISAIDLSHHKIITSNKRNKVSNELGEERLLEIAKDNPVVETFLKLAVIPTPTIRAGHLQEAEMKQNMDLIRNLTAQLFMELDPKATFNIDPYGSLIIRFPGSPGYENKKPLMFMGHLDIVPADLKDPLKQIYPVLINHPTKLKEYIATDGTTTLGADDKAQVAIIWDVIRLLKAEGKSHVPFEIVLAPDEEEDSSSLIHLDTNTFKAKDVIVIDGDEAFVITTGCASFVDIKIDLTGIKSGHSAVNDQENYISASDILVDLYQAIGNRVVKWNPDIHQPLISKNIYECEIKKAPSNAFPTEAHLAISLRSLSKQEQDNELERIKQEVKRIEEKYKNYVNIDTNFEVKLKIEEQYPPWNGSSESELVKQVKQAANEIGHSNIKITPEHGATQANHLVPKRNASGEEFSAVVVSPNLEELHSVAEKVDWVSMVTVRDWMYKFVQIYTSKN